MAIRLLKASTVNDWSTTIVDTISDSSTSIGLVSTASLNPSQLQAPGALVIDRKSISGTLTPEKREYVYFGGVSGVTLYNVTRGLNSTAQGHTLGALIEETPSVAHWGDMLDWFAVEHNSDGTHALNSHIRQVTVTGVSGASGIRGDLVVIPGSNMSIYAVAGASGYSNVVFSSPTITAGGLSPFSVNGYLATSTYVTPPLMVENALAAKSVSAALKYPASGASLVLDVNKNGTSIFASAAQRLSIAGGGTYASTASISATTFVPGDILTLDIDVGTGDTLTCLIET